MTVIIFTIIMIMRVSRSKTLEERPVYSGAHT